MVLHAGLALVVPYSQRALPLQLVPPMAAAPGESGPVGSGGISRGQEGSFDKRCTPPASAEDGAPPSSWSISPGSGAMAPHAHAANARTGARAKADASDVRMTPALGKRCALGADTGSAGSVHPDVPFGAASRRTRQSDLATERVFDDSPHQWVRGAAACTKTMARSTSLARCGVGALRKAAAPRDLRSKPIDALLGVQSGPPYEALLTLTGRRRSAPALVI